MRIVTDNATQFFAVVGAPYLAEHHLDADSEDVWHPMPQHTADLASSTPSCGSAGWWPQGDH
jgi:hypothetical protein